MSSFRPRLTEKQRKERGWYYVGKIKWYWRNCDYCGKEYRKPESKFFCDKRCMRLKNPIIMIAEKNPSWKGGKKKCVDCLTLNKGRYSVRCQVCFGKYYSGERSPSWITDRTKLKKYDRRNDSAYQSWRKEVFKKDGYRCFDCAGFGKIVAHHIFTWSNYKRLRYEVNNGITLCEPCHKTRHITGVGVYL